LNHEEVSGLRDDLLRLQETGVTVLLIEHNMGLIMTVSESVVVLDVGKKIAEGSSVEVSSDPRVISAYLGG
jgi:ABC-type branched-subunit amino acid transport system ATPase component